MKRSTEIRRIKSSPRPKKPRANPRPRLRACEPSIKVTALNLLRFAPCLGALSCVAIGCSGPAEIPATPDLSALRARYDSPSALIDFASDASDLLAEAPPLERLAAAFRALRVATDGVDEASADATPPNSSIRVQGSIHVTVRCPGAEASPVYDPATNGTISLTLAVAENAIRRDIGGLASQCVLRGVVPVVDLPFRVGINGVIALDLGRDLSFRNRWTGKLLLSLDGVFDVEGLEMTNPTARFDDGQFEHLFQRRDGSTVILSLSRDGIRLRDRDGYWFCSDRQSCARE